MAWWKCHHRWFHRRSAASTVSICSHIPASMIFDDHDVTDDWNLTVGWEHAVDQNQFATQVIGNGLAAMDVPRFGVTRRELQPRFYGANERAVLGVGEYQSKSEKLLKRLLGNSNLQDTNSILKFMIALKSGAAPSTLRRKWLCWILVPAAGAPRSRMNKPSGLMDWEKLVELQHQLLHQDSGDYLRRTDVWREVLLKRCKDGYHSR